MASDDITFSKEEEGSVAWSVSKLSKLSNLGADELSSFKTYWQTIEVRQRQGIAKQLAELADNSLELNFDDIFRFLLEDPDAEVRATAVEALWECEDRTLINPLIELMLNDPSEQVRAAAAVALGRFAMMAELGELRPKYASRVEDALFRVIDDSTQSVDIRRRAIEAISPMATERVTQIIKEAYESDDPKLKASSVFAMGRNCDDRWLPMIIDELGSDNIELRFEAVNACGQLEDRRLVPHILPLINDTDFQVQLAAVDALGHTGGALAKQALKKCLANSDEHIREAAQDALDEIAFAEDPTRIDY